MNVPLTTTIMSVSYTGFGAFNPNLKSKIAFKPRTPRTRGGFLVEYLIPRKKNPIPEKSRGLKSPSPKNLGDQNPQSSGEKSPDLKKPLPHTVP